MERLQKVMAEAGVASRRASEKLIATGHVQVNGQTVTTLGTKVTAKDKIEVDGVPLHREKQVYYLLNKPRGVISSAHDEKGRRTVVDILREDEIEERIYPVGRLDYDTTGLLLLTNDGALANKMMHPKFAVDKTYVAKVKGLISNDDLKQLRTGVKVDGRRTKPAKTRLKGTDREKKTSIVQLTIHEGHYHQVKRMLAARGKPVTYLKRLSMGPITLDPDLPLGAWRPLNRGELGQLGC